MVVSTLKAAGKRTGKIRSNLHTSQYTGSISPGHSQGQTLVEPLALPGVTRHLKFLRRTTQKRLAIHTSGLNCHWLKVVIALEVVIFLAFCGLSFCGHRSQPVWQSLYSGLEQKCPQLLRPTPGSGLCTRGPKSGHPASFHR